MNHFLLLVGLLAAGPAFAQQPPVVPRTLPLETPTQPLPAGSSLAGRQAHPVRQSLLLAVCPTCGLSAAPAPRYLPLDSLTQQITYTGIIAVPHASKGELYARAKSWFTASFTSPSSQLLADNQLAGFLVGRQFATDTLRILTIPTIKHLWYTLKVSCQDGKYRYRFTDFQFESGYVSSDYVFLRPRTTAEQECFARRKDGTPTNMAAKQAQLLDQEAQHLVAQLRAGMRHPTTGTK